MAALSWNGQNWGKTCTMVGGCLLLLPLSLDWYWGNIFVNVYSYRVSCVPECHVETPWIRYVYTSLWNLGVLVSGCMATFIGRRVMISFGMISFTGGVFASYYTVQTSATLLIVSLGGACGLGSGFVYGMVLQMATEWAKNDIALLVGILQTMLSVGPVLMKQVLSRWVDSHIEISESNNEYRWFGTECAIRSRQPIIFLVCGAFSFLVQFIGVCLMKNKEKTPTTGGNNEGDLYLQTLSQDRTPTYRSTDFPEYDQIGPHNANQNEPDSEMQEESHPLTSDVLKCMHFYTLWFVLLFSNSAFIIMADLYTAFGSINISIEYYLLADLETSLSYSVIFMNIVWALLVQRYGAKACLVLYSGVVTICCPFYYIAPMVNPWLYFFITVVYVFALCGIYTTILVAAAKIFGHDNYARNLGLVLFAAITFNACAPTIMKALLVNFGWFSVFCTISGFHCCVLLITVIFIPNV